MSLPFEVPVSMLELGCAALASLAAVVLGGLLAAGAVGAIARSAPARRTLQRRLLRNFLTRSEGGEEAWRQLVELAAAGEEAPLLARGPAALAATLRRAARRAFETPSRYEALVRVLSHGADKDDLESLLGHEPLEPPPQVRDVNQQRADQRYRASRRHLRARALTRLDGLAAELDASQLRAGVLAAFAAAPWPSLLLLMAPDLAATLAVALAAVTTAGSAALGVRVAGRLEVGSSRR